MIFLLVAVFLFLLYRTIIPGRFPRILWTILAGALLLTIIYLITPCLRIYSVHGFMHTAIVSQVMNGIVPPDNPFLAGQGLFYPWGYHFLVSLVMRTLNLSAFYSYAIINVFSFCASAFLIYKISSLLYKDKVANCLSVLFSFSGISILSISSINAMRSGLKMFIPFPLRAVPVITKFTNINGFPIGLVLFLLIILLAIKFFETKKTYFYFVLMMTANACGSFLYPALLPGMILGVCVVCIVNVILDRSVKEKFYGAIKKSSLVLIASFLGILLLSSYLAAISPGVRQGTSFLGAGPMYRKVVKGLIVSLPMLVVLFINRRLMGNVNKRISCILWSIVALTFGAYVFIRLPMGVEYKYLMLSIVIVGIFAGIVFSGLIRKHNKIAVFALICIFLLPICDDVQYKIRWQDGRGEMCLTEDGNYIYHKNKEENELYDWIRKNTDKDSIFVDYKLTVPLFTGRKLFIGLNEWERPGYNFDFLKRVCIASPVLLEKRRRIVENIYGTKGDLSDEELRSFFSRYKNEKVYMIARSVKIQQRFSDMDFNRVFVSSGKKFAVFTPKLLK